MRKSLVDCVAFVLRIVLRSRRIMALARRFPKLAHTPGAIGLLAKPARWRSILFVGRHRDAISVLEDDRGYGVPYYERMVQLQTPFMLGLPRSKDHTRLREAAMAALNHRAAAEDLESACRLSAADLIGKSTRIEVIGGLTDAVLARTMGAFLGISAFEPKDLERARNVFRHIFINVYDLPDVRDAALRDAGILRARVARAVEEPEDGVLARLLASRRMSKAEVCNQVVGVLVAWAAQVPRGMGYAIDWLLDHPGALARARDAAADDDLDTVWAVLLESMHQRAPAPAVERKCERAGRIAGVEVKLERDVMVVLTAAMWDPEFVPDTPDHDQWNLPFGYGLHQCIGIELSRRQMTAIAIELLRRPNLARDSKLKLSGPYPSELWVTYGGAW